MRSVYLFTALLSYVTLHGQTHSSLWDKLMTVKDQSNVIIDHNGEVNQSYDSIIGEYNMIPVISSSRIYAWINGTGRLYEAILSAQHELLGFKRIDSTTHSGNNFDAFIFDYHDVLYNLGGYGFWKNNGQLRFFDTVSKEWQIIALNKEIPLLHSCNSMPLWYDAEIGKIYQIGYVESDEAFDIKKIHHEVMELDLNSNKWISVGKYSDDFESLLEAGLRKSTNKFPISIATLPWGILVRLEADKLYLLDVRQNEVWQLNGHNLHDPAFQIENYVYHFYADSFYYAYNAASDRFDSVKLKKGDFIATGIRVYEQSLFWDYGYYLVSLALLSGFIYLIFRKRKKDVVYKDSDLSEPSDLFDQINEGKLIMKFEQNEINVLRLLIRNSEQKKFTTIEDLNRTLGIGNKNLNTQKKQRSDLIISLNQKLSYLTNQNGVFIQKKRTPDDKRIFEYYIDVKFIEILRASHIPDIE